jgi:sugar/nucleoside kinase (ribokinase family)
VFTDDFERFSGRGCLEALAEITGDSPPHASNIGGPAVVAMINVAQLLDPGRFSVRFVGSIGRDELGSKLRSLLARTPLNTSDYHEKPGLTPFTYVLSDPGHGGQGERSFINNIGTAWSLMPEDLDDGFFHSDIVVFGGTGLVPPLHDALDTLLPRAKAAGAFTVVNTVYDFRNQRRDPVGRWPLGSSDASYRATDLLIADREEALRLSGKASVGEALDWFVAHGVGAAVVTDGVLDIELAVGTPLFRPLMSSRLPVSRSIVRDLEAHPERKGDTTGCGDNFAGGVIASLALQKESGRPALDLTAAVAWGAACGGLACFHMGGVFTEAYPGQKRAMVNACLEADRGLP